MVTSRNGKGTISDRHALCLGLAELRYLPLRRWLEQRDVILDVGTQAGFGEQLKAQQVIRIDIDEAEIGRKNHHSFGILGGARLCLEALYRVVSATTPPRLSCAEEVAAINAKLFDPAS